MAGMAQTGGSGGGHLRRARNWLMLPSWAVIGFFLVLPVALMLVYSFLTKEFRGGVIWEFSLASYDQFFVDRGLFGDEPPEDRVDLSHDLLALDLAGGAGDALCLLIGFPTAWFIATRSPRWRGLWLFLITVPYWVNLLIRTVSMKFLIRDNGPVNEWLMAIGVIDSADRR